MDARTRHALNPRDPLVGACDIKSLQQISKSGEGANIAGRIEEHIPRLITHARSVDAPNFTTFENVDQHTGVLSVRR
ncbi:hypothetical protein D9M72_585650 [compost metagenome]